MICDLIFAMNEIDQKHRLLSSCNKNFTSTLVSWLMMKNLRDDTPEAEYNCASNTD